MLKTITEFEKVPEGYTHWIFSEIIPFFAMGLSVVPSSSCTFCADEEDAFHFFFRCPTKFVFWDALIRKFL
jgi:hypothetical protein